MRHGDPSPSQSITDCKNSNDSKTVQCCDGEFPLRVVNIKETLARRKIYFQKPKGWDFHVISHTWSQRVRELSEEIGELVGSDNSNNTTHEQAFLKVNLAHIPCFLALVKFLDLLSADGVDAIWIDALCINQSKTDNMEEKSREILRMASYYKNSKGCYVLTHGIDQGYKMWKNGVAGEVPRWFTRVWTLQECILPTKLIFIVTGYNPATIGHLNRCIREEGSSDVGACKCHFSSKLSKWTNGPSEDRVIMGTRQCGKCGSATLIRELQLAGQGELVYLVDKFAYLYLAGFEARGCKDFSQLHLLDRSITSPVKLIIALIGKRESSVEEDRVLSILGLLEADQCMSQLRVGKTLKEQVIHLAQAKLQAGDEDFLIQMMTAHSRGCDSLGADMSWAPDFKSSENISRVSMFFDASEGWRRCVEVKEIAMEGRVTLGGAKIAEVRMCVTRSPPLATCNSDVLLGNVKLASVSFVCEGEFTIVVKNPSRQLIEASTIEFDAWFLLLASEDDGDYLVMMCLKNNDARHPNDLHKLANLVLGPGEVDLVFGSLLHVSCTLGGSGSHGGLEDGYFQCSLPNPLLKWSTHDGYNQQINIEERPLGMI